MADWGVALLLKGGGAALSAGGAAGGRDWRADWDPLTEGERGRRGEKERGARTFTLVLQATPPITRESGSGNFTSNQILAFEMIILRHLKHARSDLCF